MLRVPRGTKMLGVLAEADGFPISDRSVMVSIRYYLRFTARSYCHPRASILYDRPDSLFSGDVAPLS